MEDKLTIYKAVTTAGQAILSMTQSAKSHSFLRKQDKTVFEEQLRYIRYSCRAKGYGEVFRVSIDEMEKTLQRIEQKNFSGEMLCKSMELLDMQYQALRQNLNNYMME